MDTDKFIKALENALKKGKLEGMKTSDIAIKYRVTIHQAYGALSRRADRGFTDDNGRKLYSYRMDDGDGQLAWGFR